MIIFTALGDSFNWAYDNWINRIIKTPQEFRDMTMEMMGDRGKPPLYSTEEHELDVDLSSMNAVLARLEWLHDKAIKTNLRDLARDLGFFLGAARNLNDALLCLEKGELANAMSFAVATCQCFEFIAQCNVVEPECLTELKTAASYFLMRDYDTARLHVDSCFGDPLVEGGGQLRDLSSLEKYSMERERTAAL